MDCCCTCSPCSSCCFPNDPAPISQSRLTARPGHKSPKFSFRQHAYSQSTSRVSQDGNAVRNPRLQSKLPDSTYFTNGGREEEELDREYAGLCQQDKMIDQWIQWNLKPLERQVQFYETEVMSREREIQELDWLLKQKLAERGFANPNRH